MHGSHFDPQLQLTQRCDLLATPEGLAEDGSVVITIWSPGAGGPVRARALLPKGMDLERLVELAREGRLAATAADRRGWRRLRVLRPV